MAVKLCAKWIFAGVLVLGATGAQAIDAPVRKPGLWETRMHFGGHSSVTQICVDRASEAQRNADAEIYMKEHCTRNSLVHQGNRYIADAACNFSGKPIVTHSVITMNGDGAFHTEGAYVADAVWLGPCKPGQKPGEPVMVH